MMPGPDIKQTRKSYDEHRKDSPVRQRYASYAWGSLARLIRVLNPVCQKIRTDGPYAPGERCHNFATLTHHLISPIERPDLMFTATNLVALCAACHPDSPGTPDWIEVKDFVKTNLPRHTC